ncbi:PepSY domain-containing protein [Gorillibacterium sp. sgz5001074]|uniref:PepSY domain-containing protein n=1 Tax=Gorillibacterium sp. sgz5001074 TaxID=3446695 RepID=UPI003F670620
MLTKLPALLAAGIFLLPFGGMASAEEQAVSFHVTLMENTPFYSTPDGEAAPDGALAPQRVRVTLAEDRYQPSAWSHNAPHWYRLDTWQGERWIQLVPYQTGDVEQKDIWLWLPDVTPLHESAYPTSAAYLQLSPQVVHATAYYRSKTIDAFQVDTWEGPKWITSLAQPFFPVRQIRESVQLATTASLFERPLLPSRSSELPPGTYTADLRADGDWTRIVTPNGEKGWINTRYVQPEGAILADEPVEVTVPTPLAKYPDNYDVYMGEIGPQSVRSFQKWIPPQGETWYRIRTWKGDAWIRPLPGGYITKETALELGKRMDPDGDADWSVAFEENYRLEPSQKGRPVWAVTAVYPAGNKMIVWIDAVTGKQISLTEIEGGGL